MTISTPGRLNSIQALRGIAAFVVMLYHLMNVQRQDAAPNTAEYSLTLGWWERGGIGVDLFFVISGFIMVFVTRDLLTGRAVAGDFLRRRAVRILPLWWLCLSVMVGYFLLAYGIPAAPDRSDGVRQAWEFALKSYVLWPMDLPPILGVGWTLSHEIFFYGVFAATLLIPRRFLPLILGVWLALTALAVTAFGSLSWQSPLARLIGSPMSVEFIFGALAGWLYLRSAVSRPVMWAVGLGATLFILMAACRNLIWVDDPYLNRTMVYGLPFALLVWACAQCERAGLRPRTNSALVRLGDWSYALYLGHVIIIMLTRRLFRMMEGVAPEPVMDLLISARPGALNNIINAGINIAACVFAAGLIYHWIERPLMNGFRRRRSPAH